MKLPKLQKLTMPSVGIEPTTLESQVQHPNQPLGHDRSRAYNVFTKTLFIDSFSQVMNLKIRFRIAALQTNMYAGLTEPPRC